VPLALIDALAHAVHPGFAPDRTLLLDLRSRPPHAGASRGLPADRFEAETQTSLSVCARTTVNARHASPSESGALMRAPQLTSAGGGTGSVGGSVNATPAPAICSGLRHRSKPCAGRAPAGVSGALLIHDAPVAAGHCSRCARAGGAVPHGAGPCGVCRDCRRVEAGEHPDFVRIGLLEDAKRIGVDQIRELSDA